MSRMHYLDLGPARQLSEVASGQQEFPEIDRCRPGTYAFFAFAALMAADRRDLSRAAALA
jgi:hypothetical protein